jgi:hypothetical protein
LREELTDATIKYNTKSQEVNRIVRSIKDMLIIPLDELVSLVSTENSSETIIEQIMQLRNTNNNKRGLIQLNVHKNIRQIGNSFGSERYSFFDSF